MQKFPTRSIPSIALALSALLLLPGAATEPALQTPLTWSHPDLDKTPIGNLQFHGPFENETVRATAPSLAPHVFLDISFDLLILRSWDGSVPMSEQGRPQQIGPDFFRCALASGPTLLYTTFSNRPTGNDFQDVSKYQNYPSQIPGTHLDPQTGADAKNTLGYNYPWAGPTQLFPMDATYHIHFIIPHNTAQATVEFGAMNLSNFIDENWGIANLQIKPLPLEAVEHPDPAGIAAAFAHALDAAAADQTAAFQKLILGMDDTADWIAANVQPQPIDSAKLNDALKNLAADDSNVPLREQAPADLHALGPQAEPYLRDARQTAPGEVRQRIDWTLQWIGTTEITDDNLRRVLLATRVLEIIATPHALEVRKHLTEG
jgi:hypothetical protein